MLLSSQFKFPYFKTSFFLSQIKIVNTIMEIRYVLNLKWAYFLRFDQFRSPFSYPQFNNVIIFLKIRQNIGMNFLIIWLQGFLKPELNILSLPPLYKPIANHSESKNTFNLLTFTLCPSFNVIEIVGLP